MIRRRIPVYFAIWIVLSLYAWRVSLKSNPQGDEPHYLMMTVSLLHDWDFDLANNFQSRDFEAFTTWNLEPQRVQTRNNRLVTAHEPGLPILCAMPYRIGGRFGVTLFLTALSALGIVGLQHLTWRLTGSALSGWMAVLILLVSLPWPMLGAMVFPDVPAAVALIFALLCITSPSHTLRPLILSTLLLIALPFLHTKYALFSIALFGMLYVTRRPKMSQMILLVMTILLGTGIYVAAQYWIFGDPLFLLRVRAQGFVSPLIGLIGMLWDRETGLLTYAPVYALALPGFFLMRRRSRSVIWMAAIGLAYIVMNASWLDWHGGHCPPARYLAPVLPFFAMMAGTAIASPQTRSEGVYLRILAFLFIIPTVVQTMLLTLRVPESVIVRGDGHRMLWDGMPRWSVSGLPSLLNPEPFAVMHAVSLTIGMGLLVIIGTIRSARLRAVLSVIAAGSVLVAGRAAYHDLQFRVTLDSTPLSNVPPKLTAPIINSECSSNFPDLEWDSVSGADGYRWYLSFPDGYEVASETHRDTRLDIPDSFSEAMPDGEYSWRVVPLKKGTEGTSSEISRFRFVKHPSTERSSQ